MRDPTKLIEVIPFYISTLGSGYIEYIVFLTIPSILASHFWSQKEVYIIDYFGNIIILNLSSIFDWSQADDTTGTQCRSYELE